MTDRKKPGWALWTTIALVAALLYVVSFGPACWWASTPGQNAAMDADAPAIYIPIGWIYRNAGESGWICTAIRWYATRRRQIVTVRYSTSGERVWLIR